MFNIVMTFVLAVLFVLAATTPATAAKLQRKIVAFKLKQEGTTLISNLPPPAAVTEILNKAGWDEQSYILRFYSYGPKGEIRSIWHAAIFDTKTPVPEGWQTFDVTDSKGQKYKLASYADTTKVASDGRLGVEMVYWR